MPVPTPVRTLARVIFALALAGILVVTHLGLQVQKGFADGCTGFGDVAITADGMAAGPEASGCGAVATGEYADFLGVSNIAWGLLFYIGLALLRLGYAVSGNDRVRLAAFGMAAAGFLYTLRLVYLQAFVIGEYCILCMTSAALVTLLFALHLWEHRKLAGFTRHSAAPPSTSAALRPYGVLAGVFALLLAADVALAGGDGPAHEPQVAANGQGPDTQNAASGGEMPSTPLGGAPVGCAYDPVFPPLTDLSAFTDNPSQGTGPVTVVEVFDPNCGGCQALRRTLEPVKEQNLGRATFYSVPYPLRQPAVAQAAALVLARDSEGYFDFVGEMFERLDGTWGMTPEEIREAANEAGLDGPSIIATLETPDAVEPVLAEVQEDAQAVQQYLATPDGGTSTPKLVINGRVVAATVESYSERCLNQFIAEAAGETIPEAVVEEVQ